MSKRFDRALESATDQTHVEPNWESILECVDMIRGNDVPVKHALPSIQKRYHHENPHVAHHALLVLEACVKNCGTKFHAEIANKEFMDDIKNIVIQGANEKVKQKVLELIQCWASAFRNKPELHIFADTHNLMKMNGYEFPAMKEADAMFVAESAPDWADGDSCYRCRTEFGLLTRKHHCRACGQIFCDRCSNKQMFLPQFGIEKKVRVCESCFNKRQEKAAQFGPTVKTDKPSSNGVANGDAEKQKMQELIDQENEEWQLALAISQSEAEAKEQERQRELYRLYNGTDANEDDNSVIQTETDFPSITNFNGIYKGAASTVITETPSRMENDESPVDPALAKYLDRGYWERQRSGQEDGGVFRATAPPPSEHSSSTSQFMPNTNLSTPVPTPTQNGFFENDAALNGTAALNHLSDALGKVQLANADDGEVAETSQFCNALKEQVDTMSNRMRSNKMRNRSIVNDSAIHSLFVRLTERHAEVLERVSKLDQAREYYEGLQDQLAHIQETRQAVNDMREDYERQRQERLRQEQIQRQQQMQYKLGFMRHKKHEMLLQQRHMTLQRFQENEQQFQQRRFQQPGQYQQMGYQQQPQQIPGYGPYPGYDQQAQYHPGYYPPNAGYDQTAAAGAYGQHQQAQYAVGQHGAYDASAQISGQPPQTMQPQTPQYGPSNVPQQPPQLQQAQPQEQHGHYSQQQYQQQQHHQPAYHQQQQPMHVNGNYQGGGGGYEQQQQQTAQYHPGYYPPNGAYDPSAYAQHPSAQFHGQPQHLHAQQSQYGVDGSSTTVPNQPPAPQQETKQVEEAVLISFD